MALRILRLLGACGVLIALGAPACGGSSSDQHPTAGSAGSAGVAGLTGSGGSTPSGHAGGSASAGAAGTSKDPNACGDATCKGIVIPGQNITVPGCCADEATSHCGLDASVLEMFGATFAETCQPLAQPAIPDTSCPMSAKVPVEGTAFEIQLEGCCRADHVCGYKLDTVGGLLKVGLGCVDSTPFLGGAKAQTCGEAGAAGAGGEAGAAGESSVAGAGGNGGSSAGGSSGGSSAGGSSGGDTGGTNSGGTNSAGSSSGGGTSGGGTGGTGG